MQVKKQQLEPDMEQWTGSKLVKDYVKAVYSLFNLFNLYAEYILQNTRLDDSQARIKTASGNISNLRYTDDTTLMAESKEELKRLLMRVKEQNEKPDFKLNVHKTKILPSSPIISWQIDGENVETVADFIFLGSKITADGDYSHIIKRCSFEEKL